MEITIVAVLFLALCVATFTFGLALVSSSSVLRTRLQGLIVHAVRPQKPPVGIRIANALAPVSKVVPKSPDEISDARLTLMQGGFREDWHATVYFSLPPLLLAITIIVAVFSGLMTRSLILTVVLSIIAWMLPRFVLGLLTRRRQAKIRLGLPDALDLTVICVEAGLGLDQSLQRVGVECRIPHPELSDELQLVNLELRAGKPRPEALRNFALRTAVEEVRALVAVLIQTDRFGTDVAQALRVHSDALRTARRQRAEEDAAKTTIKMVPVLVLCILPALFLVVLGPPIILAIRAVGPVLHPQP